MNPNIPNREQELTFDSTFESGNLDEVIKVGPWEYDLYMRVDTNTRGHHQWFYFSITYDSCEGHFNERKL
jgi:cytosolic carboxypeptidase protein 2/3